MTRRSWARAACSTARNKFDAAFFGMTPNEALITDPQHRVFLECAWEALESAGVDPARYSGSVGVYAGMSNNSYFQSGVVHRPDLQKAVGTLQTMMGNEKDYLATRTAYKLNLKGPAISLYTACSTSLVAVCQACASLLSYQCDLALAGGVSIVFPQARGYRYEEGGILSPRRPLPHVRRRRARNGVLVGRGRRRAEETERGPRGRRHDPRRDQGRGTQQRRRPQGQLHRAVGRRPRGGDRPRPCARGHFEPGSLSYIEAHGTATPLGDPIEIAGLTQAFRASTDEVGFCAIGSVKTNIGHLDAAAGIAGLIKTVLALKNREIPASLHFTAPEPEAGPGREPVRGEHRAPPVGAPRRKSPSRGRQLVRRRRNQRPRDRRGSPESAGNLGVAQEASFSFAVRRKPPAHWTRPRRTSRRTWKRILRSPSPTFRTRSRPGDTSSRIAGLSWRKLTLRLRACFARNPRSASSRARRRTPTARSRFCSPARASRP